MSEASVLSLNVIKIKRSGFIEHLIFNVSWLVIDMPRNCLPWQAQVLNIIHFLRDNPSYDLDQTLFNELSIREWFTMLRNKMSYFVARLSSIFGNILSTMKNILLKFQASFQFVKFIFPFYRTKRAIAFVTWIVVTLQVVFFWSRYRLFAIQTYINYWTR